MQGLDTRHPASRAQGPELGRLQSQGLGQASHLEPMTLGLSLPSCVLGSPMLTSALCNALVMGATQPLSPGLEVSRGTSWRDLGLVGTGGLWQNWAPHLLERDQLWLPEARGQRPHFSWPGEV